MHDVVWYQAWGAFKLAVILQNIYIRWLRGQTQDQRFATTGERVAALIERGCTIAGLGDDRRRRPGRYRLQPVVSPEPRFRSRVWVCYEPPSRCQILNGEYALVPVSVIVRQWLVRDCRSSEIGIKPRRSKR